ncbi:MAG TPA: S41 family peptidase [Reyranellaceae bacterium]|nr:S41 family peptidase [Reyranellaceae bacterium]
MAASLVASCETHTPVGPATNGAAAASNDVALERVILQAYRAIGDRHLYDPDFRKLAPETYRGFAASDPAMSLRTGNQSYTIVRDGKEVLSRPIPESSDDGRAWGGLMAELMAASLEASPTLKRTNRQTLIKGALTATTKLLDRNTRYADPDEARENRFQRDGGGGVGITVERTDDKRVLIRNVQDNAPAARAGLRVGDQIVAIDNLRVGERGLAEVVAQLRGPVGAPVVITVQRTGDARELPFEVKRGRIVPTTVLYERQGDVARIRLIGFNSATTDTLRATIDKARAEIPNMSGMILDMRGNRGGLLDQALSVSEVFIADGPVFSTAGRHPDSRRNYRSAGNGKTAPTPMVVLINGHSASAAEIVAAALQDRGRAVLVGTTSYGKGTVQTVVRLANEAELIMTWSRLQAPSGYTWNELGVLPNVCSASVGDLPNYDADSTRASLMRWHALRNPTAEEVTALRKICPPGEGTPDRDLEIANRLLADRQLYARAVRAGYDQAAIGR